MDLRALRLGIGRSDVLNLSVATYQHTITTH